MQADAGPKERISGKKRKEIRSFFAPQGFSEAVLLAHKMKVPYNENMSKAEMMGQYLVYNFQAGPPRMNKSGR